MRTFLAPLLLLALLSTVATGRLLGPPVAPRAAHNASKTATTTNATAIPEAPKSALANATTAASKNAIATTATHSMTVPGLWGPKIPAAVGANSGSSHSSEAAPKLPAVTLLGTNKTVNASAVNSSDVVAAATGASPTGTVSSTGVKLAGPAGANATEAIGAKSGSLNSSEAAPKLPAVTLLGTNKTLNASAVKLSDVMAAATGASPTGTVSSTGVKLARPAGANATSAAPEAGEKDETKPDKDDKVTKRGAVPLTHTSKKPAAMNTTELAKTTGANATTVKAAPATGTTATGAPETNLTTTANTTNATKAMP